MEGTDEVAKIQLKSQFAIGEATAISGVGLAALGMMTGYNSGQLTDIFHCPCSWHD